VPARPVAPAQWNWLSVSPRCQALSIALPTLTSLWWLHRSLLIHRKQDTPEDTLQAMDKPPPPLALIKHQRSCRTLSLPLNKLLASHSNSLQFCFAATRSLSAYDQRRAFLLYHSARHLAFGAARSNARRLVHPIPIAPIAVSSNWILSKVLAGPITQLLRQLDPYSPWPPARLRKESYTLDRSAGRAFLNLIDWIEGWMRRFP